MRHVMHQRRNLVLVLCALAGQAIFAQPVSDPLGSLRLLPPVLVKGEKGWSLQERMKHYRVEGLSVALIQDCKVVWTAAAGLADREEGRKATPHTLFQAGSISKPVAAAGMLRKAQEGAWATDRDVNDYLKSWKLPQNGFTASEKVTLERILTHSAGLTVHGFPGYEPGQRIPSVPQVLDGAPPANTAPVRVDTVPGTKWRYSGGGYTVAQLAMTDTFGQPFPELMERLVLSPAGMRSSTYQQPLPPERLALAAAGYRSNGAAVPGKRHTYPEMAAAGLWTTAEDLALFAVAIQKALRGDADSLLSQKTAARMVTSLIGDYGLGFHVENHNGAAYFEHGGADEGFQALLIASRDTGWGAAVMVNSDNGIALANEIVNGLASQYGWKGFLPEPLETIQLAPERLAAMAGRYLLNGDEATTFESRGPRLFGKPPVGPEYELFAIADDLFVRTDRDTRYRILTTNGAVTGVQLIAGDLKSTARRMDPAERLPSDDLNANRLEEAIRGYRKLHTSNPQDAGVAEPRLNRLGYDFLGRGEFSKAITVLKLNTEFYPRSTNTYDSLGEAYLTSGDRARALEMYRKVLEAASKDKTTDAPTLDLLRRNAQAKVKELTK